MTHLQSRLARSFALCLAAGASTGCLQARRIVEDAEFEEPSSDEQLGHPLSGVRPASDANVGRGVPLHEAGAGNAVVPSDPHPTDTETRIDSGTSDDEPRKPSVDPAGSHDEPGDDSDAGEPEDAVKPTESWAEVADPKCSKPGCIRNLWFVGSYTHDDLAPYADSRVTFDNGYSVAVIEYVTKMRTSYATITIPYPLEVPAHGYHIVVNAHGTTGLDDPCVLSGTVYATGLAGYFGGRGAISIAPDYPGLGTDGLLPYLVSEVEGAAALDAIRAADELAQFADIRTSGRSAVVGLSEGGHAVLAAAALHAHYAPELDVRAFGAAGPATVWLEQFQMGVSTDGPHVSFHAFMLYAWAKYYNYSGKSIWTPSVAKDIDDIMAKDCSWDFGGMRETFEARLGDVASDIFDPDFLDAYEHGKLDTFAPTFAAAFAANRVKPFEQTAPIAIWQGAADTSVPEPYTTQVVDALRAGGMDIDYRVVPDADHLDVAFGFLAQYQVATQEAVDWTFEKLNCE